jgi:transcription elongation factor GreA
VILERLVRLHVAQADVRADRDGVLRDLLLRDHPRGEEALLELGDLVLQHRLLVLRVVVLGVLGDVAELAGDADPLGDLAALLVPQEIDFLRTEKRREVAERIRVAREFGDIAENAEYDDAKNEQAMLEHKIAQLEERLLSARVITKKEISKDAVSVGSKVRLRDMGANKTFEYHIVGSAEANPTENKLSNESPVGKAILGRKKGETVEVTAPRGTLKFKILEIKAA